MGKIRLELGAELDTLNRGELAAELDRAGEWQRQAASGLRHFDLPIMYGTVSAGAITLGGDQPDAQQVGPKSGFYWKITRVSVEGLAAADVVSLYKGAPAIGKGRFVANILGTTGTYSPGSQGLILTPGDVLGLTGSALTATGEIRVSGEGVSVPGPFMWKLFT
jgi:hypothetical protein